MEATATGTTVFNPIQLYLLQLFSKMESEQELEEVKQVLADYYFKKVEKRAAEISEEKGWTHISAQHINSAADEDCSRH